MQCPSCAAPASEGQSHCARCRTPLSALAGAYAAPTSSTEKTIMFDRAPWPQAEEPAGAWTPAPPPAGQGAEAPGAPAAQAPRPGEATEWWTPAMDGPSGPVPLPQQQSSWSPPPAEPVPAAPQAPETPAVPAVPDSWFAGPVRGHEADAHGGEFQQTQTGPFTPVFDDAPERPAPPVAFPADSTFAAVGMPEPARPDGHDSGPYPRPDGHESGPYARPGALAAESPLVTQNDFSAEAPYVPQNGLAAEPPRERPDESVSEPPYAQQNGFVPGPPYAQPEYVQPEYAPQEYAQPEYAQPYALASEPPYAAPQQGGYEQPQQGFAHAAPGATGGTGGFQQPPAWGGPREEIPPWGPGGAQPPTQPPGPPPAGGGAKNKPLLIGVAALVAVALVSVAFVFLGGGDDGPKKVGPTSTAAAPRPEGRPVAVDSAAVKQAKQVQALLNASAKSRGLLGGALAQARRCAGLPASITTMQQVAQQRQEQWKRARQLDVPDLPEAVKLRSSLARSFKLSLDVDLAYLAWARGNQGCKGKTPAKGANYKRGAALSAQATRAKNRFLQLWNPVAPKYGLAERKSF